MNNCEDCKHFDRSERLADGLGQCALPEDEAKFLVSGYAIEGLYVFPDFGCVQFEAK